MIDINADLTVEVKPGRLAPIERPIYCAVDQALTAATRAGLGATDTNGTWAVSTPSGRVDLRITQRVFWTIDSDGVGPLPWLFRALLGTTTPFVAQAIGHVGARNTLQAYAQYLELRLPEAEPTGRDEHERERAAEVHMAQLREVRDLLAFEADLTRGLALSVCRHITQRAAVMANDPFFAPRRHDEHLATLAELAERAALTENTNRTA